MFGPPKSSNLNDQALRMSLPGAKSERPSRSTTMSVLSGSVANVQEGQPRAPKPRPNRFTGSADKVVNNLSIEQRQAGLLISGFASRK